MTDNQKACVQFLSDEFDRIHKATNPYIKSGELFHSWYRSHPSTEPIPTELLPTGEQFINYDIRQAIYVASQIMGNYDYGTLLAYEKWAQGKPIEEAVRSVVDAARPCECTERQCSFFCKFYGVEDCLCGQ